MRIGETTAEQFELIPARAQVLQHVDFKYACRSCEGASHEGPAAVTAPLPKNNGSPGLAAFITVSKYADGMPLYRLEGILARYVISVSGRGGESERSFGIDAGGCDQLTGPRRFQCIDALA